MVHLLVFCGAFNHISQSSSVNGLKVIMLTVNMVRQSHDRWFYMGGDVTSVQRRSLVSDVNVLLDLSPAVHCH